MVNPPQRPLTAASRPYSPNTSPHPVSEGEQGVQFDSSDNTRGNSDLEIILPDSEDERQASQAAKQSAGKGKKRNKGKRKKAYVLDRLSQSLSTSSPTITSNMPKRVLGQLAPAEQLFCPLSAVTKFPYKYIRGEDSDKVSNAFFAGGKFRARGWTLFYIHTSLHPPVKPLIVVPAADVEEFLSEINAKFRLQLGFPHRSVEPGFLLSFVEKGSPRPRYLGRLNAEDDLNIMESKIPGPDFTQDGDDAVDSRSFAAFRVKMEAAIQAGKNKSKASKERKKGERIVLKRSWCAELKRIRCYLGLRPRWTQLENPHEILNLTWDEFQAAEAEYETAKMARVQRIDVMKPVPNPFHQDVVFISVDVECYERSRKTITEIGISTLDTNDLNELPPGEGGIAWMKKIRSRHFRINENSHLENKDFVIGCADRFEKHFGKSEWISIKEAPQVVASCFKYPFSASGRIGQWAETLGENAAPKSLSNDTSETSSNPPTTDDAARRNIVLVGHDVKTDVDYLRAIGYDVGNLPDLLEAIDTADLYRALTHEHQPRNLGSILLDLGLVGWNLHNAGNDAAYTLQALVGICLKSQDLRTKRLADLEKRRADQIEDASSQAKQRIIQDAEEWELADDDEGDGGSPVGLIGLDPASQGGSSKVNRAERLAKEEIEVKERNKREEMEVSSGDLRSQETKNTKPVDGRTDSTEQGLAHSNYEGVALSNHQQASSFADQDVTKPVNGITNSVDGEPATQPNGGTCVPKPELNEANQITNNESTRPEPPKPTEAGNTLETPVDDHGDKDDAPISARALDRLAFLESMDAEDNGGVKL